MAADSVGLFDNGVHAQLGDLLNERVLVAFPVLHHCGAAEGKQFTLCTGYPNTDKPVGFKLFVFYRGPSCACTR